MLMSMICLNSVLLQNVNCGYCVPVLLLLAINVYILLFLEWKYIEFNTKWMGVLFCFIFTFS